jgi:hypothetical protein
LTFSDFHLGADGLKGSGVKKEGMRKEISFVNVLQQAVSFFNGYPGIKL